MTKQVSLEQMRRLVEDGVEIDGELREGHYALISKPLQGTQYAADYPLFLVPKELPVDGRGGFLIPGRASTFSFCPFFDYGLGLPPREGRLFIETGHFEQEEGKSPYFTLLHPNESDHLMLHVLYGADEEPSSSGLDSHFGKLTHAVWYRHYEGMYNDDTLYKHHDIWVLPTGGVVEPIILQLAATNQRLIDAGEAEELKYQKYKAGFRAAMEASGLIERFREAYGKSFLLTLTEDHLSIMCEDGVEDQIRYTVEGFVGLNRSVEWAEQQNALLKSGDIKRLLMSALIGLQ